MIGLRVKPYGGVRGGKPAARRETTVLGNVSQFDSTCNTYYNVPVNGGREMTFKEADKKRGLIMKYVYPACFYKEKDDRYSVDIPDFGMATFGDDLADALYMAADAIAGRVHLAIRNGEPLPAPSGIKDVTPDKSSGFVSMIYVDLDAMTPAHKEKPVKKTLTIPSWLNIAAERKNINFSATLRDALIEKLTSTVPQEH